MTKDLNDHGLKALSQWQGFQGLPDFSSFSDDDFKPAFDLALTKAEAEIEALAQNSEVATVENFLIPFQLSGNMLDRVSSIFWMRSGAHSNEVTRALEQDFAPRLSRFSSHILMDERIFKKIDHLYQNRENLGLDEETKRVIEESWKGFTRNGARLGSEDKKHLAKINERLAMLGAQFGQNILHDEAEWVLFLESDNDLAGLPDDLRAAMREAAKERGKDNAYALTLSRAIIDPFLTFSKVAHLREKAHEAWIKRGENNGDHDNRANIRETVKLRDEKAKLLGYQSFADYKLDNTMAKTPQHVMDLLLPVWQKAKAKAEEEYSELQDLAASQGDNGEIKASDWRYYAEQLKAQKFAFDEAELKPYLQLDEIINAALYTANRLFGLQFEEKKGVALWHKDARLFIVRDENGMDKGLFIGDYFARSSKRSGAWMSALQSQHKLAGGEKPIIYNVMNFARPPEGETALLSLDDARTLFHEFGHALHGLLSDVTWPSVSGTSVSRDFVELPSQLYEHWLTVPQVLEKFARHYKTGEIIPDALLQKVLASRTFNAGFETVEYTSSALIDMAFHKGGEVNDPSAFEQEQLIATGQPKAIGLRHRPPHFAHIFAGDGYSAGYYSYMWSEVLDADAFEAFEETGDAFNSELAARLKKYIYSAGGSKDPETLYKEFRGRMPTPDAMMRDRGL
ncbi:M3 family metallopeptidase [Bartonella sp. HY761]|uniref:M3 family metallopeptidase n=1 Tax=Bartonella sp. HY761 TaxID=2979330 RepID=UPI002201113A|nr:M3 family metallopeptidase [Bartonella sp. HY761]UXN06659.1 M3 family metallopeptidase [Bartonella sp. HY761]